MTILKFVSITNIGRFKSYAVRGDMELRKLNVIFAENGKGKTTLCAILRSLKTGLHNHISERLTIGATSGAQVSLLTSSGMATFQQTSWSKTIPELEIFDSRFVSENIHIGDSVETKNQRNLATVILGVEGFRLITQIKAEDELSRTSLEAMRVSERKLLTKSNGLDINRFSSITIDPAIDDKTLAKSKEIEQATHAAVLIAQKKPSHLPLPHVSANLIALLGETLASVSAVAEQRVRSHLAQSHMHDAEGWLADGLNYMAGESCPVCGQEIEGNDLIGAYQSFFSEAYSALKEKIDGLDALLNQSIGGAFSRAFKEQAVENDNLMVFWDLHIKKTVSKAPPLEASLDIRQAIFKGMKELIDKKKRDMLTPVYLTPELADLTAKLSMLSEAIPLYNAEIDSTNIAIDAIKRNAGTISVTTLQNEFKSLQSIKDRHSPEVVAEFIIYWSAKAARDKAVRDKAAHVKALGVHSSAVVTKHEERINTLLTGFGADFRVKGVRTTFPSGVPASAFSIEINKVATPAGKTPENPVHSFHSLLSAGDKSALALAFFLSGIDLEPNKADRIIVLDDPFTSQDEHRRFHTCTLIHDYVKDCKQVIISSHDSTFLRSVWDGCDGAKTKCLKIAPTTMWESTIEEWPIEEETKHAYLKLHQELTDYSSGRKQASPSDMIQKPRVLLEDYIRFRFPNIFNWNNWLGDMIEHIEGVGSAHPMYPHLHVMKAANGYTAPAHHGSSTTRPTAVINETAVRTCVRQVLEIVGGS